METILSEVEEHAIQEKGLSDGPSNPVAQHAYEGFSKKQSRSGSGLFVGAAAVALALALASIFGFWLLRSVRRLNRQVARLNRQTELLDRRVQAAEQQATASAQQASQAAADAQAAVQHDQVKASTPTTAAQTPSGAQAPPAAHTAPSYPSAQGQPAPEKTVAGQAATPTAPKAGNRNQHEDKLQKLQQSLSQIAQTRRTSLGLVMTLGERAIRFDSGKSYIAPQYRAILNRIAGVLRPLKGYSIYVYGYSDDDGTKDYNLTLSARRARAVRDGLVNAGVDPSVVSTKGFGKSQPRVRGTDPKTRAANRRMEIGIVDSPSAAAKSTTASKGATKR